jgi:hypothetical protein
MTERRRGRTQEILSPCQPTDSTQEIRVRRRIQSWIRTQSASTMTPSPQLRSSFLDLRNFDTIYIEEININFFMKVENVW